VALEPGGYADKLGNRYEGRWVVKHLLCLLNEELMYVSVEAVGDDEEGADLWVTRHDGTRQAQQCKARNGSKDSWTVSDLNGRGILAAMRLQLDRHDNHEFALVSAVPATVLGDICESARQSTGDPETFYRHQIDAIGEGRRKAFRQFCEYLGLDSGQREGRAAAYEYLWRMHLILWPDDQNSRDELLACADMLSTGQPEAVVTVLAEYAQSNLRRNITSNDVRQYLSSLGFHPRRLAHDVRIGPTVEELQRQFEESIASGLVAGKLIAREETIEVLEALKADGVVVLHGAAGYGKTGVLYELTQVLRQQGHVCIPVRLDRRTPSNTTHQFGEDLGLPESPALCLEPLTGEKMAVLVLDQLDALRWTSAHSANALDVCKSLVLEVRNLRNLGKDIGVVLACRTFDLEHDPEIKDWLKKSSSLKCHRVEVKSLPEDTVRGIVEDLGRDFTAMPATQKRILQTPQHLAMWAELAGAGEVEAFQTGTQLMRLFWENQYRELAKTGVSAAQADEVIDRVTEYMERNSQVSAPYSLVADRPRELAAIQSHGILHATRNQVSFCHQSYLDFRIATRLLKQVHQGTGTVRAWLGDKSQQSLFRREQLRQVLSLLSEESPQEFLISVREILGAEDVRFHLKHLVLELVGQIDEPAPALLVYLRDLLSNDYWKDHVVEVVLAGHRQYIEWLAHESILSEWLELREDKDIRIACWLLRSVAEKSPDFVAEILQPYAVRDDEWAKRVLSCLCWSEQDDFERMFELRLRLARRGIVKGLVSWSRLAAKSPLRAVQLIEAIVSTWRTEDFQNDGLGGQLKRGDHSRLDEWTNDDHEALMKVAADCPEYVWDQFMPHIERLTSTTGEDDHHIRAWQDGNPYAYEEHTGAARGIVELTIEAGKSLARCNHAALLCRTRPIQDSKSAITQYILAEAYATLPGEHADETLAWLMADPVRLNLGSGNKEPEWMPAVRLVNAHSPHCSEELFRRLEAWLVHHHDPDEKKTAEWCLKGWKEGWFHDFWGRAQYFLLPALCSQRRRKETSGLIGVLQRRFAGYEQWRFLRSGHSTGGGVGSTLPSEKLERVSDKSWLEIVSNKEVPTNHGRWSKQVGRNALAESSVRMFSRDLGYLSKRFPERFGRLALRFPADINPDYVKVILEGMKETQPKDVPDAERATWRPAGMDLVEAILTRFPSYDDRGVASAFCWLIHDRADEEWSDDTIARLIRYATEHSDPEPGQLNMWPSGQGRDVAKATVHGLEENALNCVRGVGALAVGALLRHHPDWLVLLGPCMSRLVSDPHPVVRTAAVEACLPVLNIDRDKAISWFCVASRDDLRVPASRAGLYFFNCGMQSHYDQLASLIRQMVTADSEEVVQEGAEEITARWLFQEMFEDELETCRYGTAPQRKGVAQVASRFLLNLDHTTRCEGLLLPLYDDEDVEVRRETRRAFRDKRVLSLPNAQGIVARYIKSRAFADDPSPLMWSLKEFSGSLIPFSELILMVCEVFASSLRDASRDMSTGVAADAYMIPPMLLRLYEQAQDQDDTRTLSRCLDAWDLMFEHRIGVTRDLTQAIEQ